MQLLENIRKDSWSNISDNDLSSFNNISCRIQCLDLIVIIETIILQTKTWVCYFLFTISVHCYNMK